MVAKVYGLMPQLLWFAPLAVLILALGLSGFRLGWIAATITETDVIETYSGRYVQSHGGAARVTDCTARPGNEPGVWIVVTCVSPSGARFGYAADRLGRLVPASAAPSPVAAPET